MNRKIDKYFGTNICLKALLCEHSLTLVILLYHVCFSFVDLLHELLITLHGSVTFHE